LQVAAGCNEKKTLSGCSINVLIEKIELKNLTTLKRNLIIALKDR